MTTALACIARETYQMPAGVLTIAVQQLLSVLQLRMGIVERHSDRNGAAIFSVARNRGTGKSVVEIAVPYCSYEGRTVILSILTGTVYRQRDIRWQSGGRPGIGSKAIAFFPATEECVVRWSSAMKARFNEKLADVGFTGACETGRQADRRSQPVLELKGAKYELPTEDACEKASIALGGGCVACSKAELESLAVIQYAGLQVVHVVNEGCLGNNDCYLLLSRKSEITVPQAAQPRRRVRLALAA